MKNTYKILGLCLLALVVFTGCKSTTVLAEGETRNDLSSRVVIRNHLQGAPDFKTLSGRLGISYSDGESSQSVNVSLRIKKDEIIWISAPLGMVKAYITPNRVSFYNKLTNEYFDGDYSYFSNLLGTEIDFLKLQNLLLGQSIVDLRDQKYEMNPNGDHYELKPRNTQNFLKLAFQLEPTNFRVLSQQLAQPMMRRLLEVRYPSYQKVAERILPDQVKIAAIEDQERVLIDLEYKSLDLDRSLSYPYKIPNGFKRIESK